MDGWARAAGNLYIAQGDAAKGALHPAVVAWMNYRTPRKPLLDGLDFGVLKNTSATAGAERLAGDVRDLTVARARTDYRLSIVAHSYGTTTVAHAAAHTDLSPQAIVFLGSAGTEPGLLAEDLHAGKVYAGQARNVIPFIEAGQGDEFAEVGRRLSGRTDPMDPEFGAATFGTNGVVNDIHLHGVTAHDVLPSSGYGYLSENTESLRNTALATTGIGEPMTPHVDPGRTGLEEGACRAASRIRLCAQ
jgi:pimeloyl-ACP methyl ester carboxylesterase